MYKMICVIEKLWRNHWLLLSFILLFMTAGCAAKPPAEPTTVTPEPATRQSIIRKITVNEEQTSVLVTVRANQPLAYSSVKHFTPLGVVLYFPKTSLKGVRDTYTPESALIKKIIASELTEGYSRIQINLTDDVPYKIMREGNRLLINFRKPVAARSVGEDTAVVVPEETEQATVSVLEEEVVKFEKPAWVNRIDFVALEGGKSRVIIGATKMFKYKTEKPSSKRLLLKLFNTKISKSQMRPLITTRFNSAVDRIVPVQTAKMGDIAVIAIQLREAVPYRVEQQENLFMVDFEPSIVLPRPLLDVRKPKWEQAMMKETEAAIVRKGKEVPSVQAAALTDTGEGYTGRKISLDFQDADIRHVFRILHEISGKNFVIGADVKGRVTLKLENVPWDQVLDLVTRMNKLGTIEEGNIVRIAPLATLEAEEKALEAKKAVEPLVTEYIPVSYADASSIKTQLDEIKTERGKVATDARTNMIIMKDTRAAIDNAREVVNRLDVVTPQVMIEARIVEATTNFAREFGIKWGGQTYHSSDSTTRRLFGASAGGDYDDAVGATNFAVNLPPTNLPTATLLAPGLGFTFGTISSAFNLDLRLMAMETNSKGKIISAPRIATLDNKKAMIKQGIEYPINKEDEAGNVITEYRDVDLLLEVTPHVTPDNRVSVKIKATKNDLGDLISGIQSFTTNEAESELLVNDGETIVIGGIIKDTFSWSEAKVPFFGDIPILGWLFKSKYRKTEKAELLIFITPRIIRLEKAPQVAGS